MDRIQGSPRPGSTKVRSDHSKPESPYLHDRLQARRNQTKRSRRSDFGPRLRAFDDDIFLAEAETSLSNTPTRAARRETPESAQNAHHAQNVVSQSSHVLGARELDKRLDQLSKLNFDLKMELFHCREKMAKMQERCDDLAARADKSERIEDENRTLLDLNDSLVKELERRDAAVQEAVSIICELEEKVEHLEHDRPLGSPKLQGSAKRYLSPGSTLNGIQPITLESFGKPGKPSKRVPSFVCEKKSSTTALRSVYLEPVPKLKAFKSFASLLSQRESRAEDEARADFPDSPRLSVLSESSFPSIYDPNKPSDSHNQALAQEHLPFKADQAISQPTYDRYRSDNTRISQWVENRVSENRSRQTSIDRYPAQPVVAQTSQRQALTGLPYQSRGSTAINDTSEPALQSPWDADSALPRSRDHKKSQTRGTTGLVSSDTGRPSLGGPIFGDNVLPPTPESASTRLLRESHSSTADSRSLGEHSARLTNVNRSMYRPSTASNITDIDPLQESRSPAARSWQESAVWHGTHGMVSSSDEDDDIAVQDGDAASSTIRDLGDGSYPNGGSIVTGTPSRFQIRHASPAIDILFNGDGIDDVPRPAGKRRNTSADIHSLSGLERPDLDRADTSPNFPRAQTQAQASSASHQVSPKRHLHRTPEKRRLSDRRGSQKSPSKPSNTTAIAAAAMRSSLSQKTQRLFRRMSDSRGELTASGLFVAISTPARGERSPKRPSTARNSEPSLEQGIPNNACMSAAEKNTATSADPVRRPSSNGRASMALLAANQALTSRRQSDGPLQGKESPNPNSNRGMFRRAGSVRR